ncbi:MAG TPA: tannase/feruloyl esterase family alpha/beta hydrolase [Myxococcales bacterium]|nr:tannase/feruloyl esterase family alpha/beta hydrolase [Myxococcales bacterium]
MNLQRKTTALFCFPAAAMLLAASGGYARDDDRGRSRPAACSDLASFTSEGNTTVTSATLVTSGTLVTPNNLTLTNLPVFCRVQGTSRPTSDSNIFFEVWLPSATWNGKFLSSGEGGYAGAPNYTRLGLDGGLDELLRRGYATASTDTGHSASDTWWAVGHRQRAVDYLYRAKHLVTVAAKSLVRAYYGRAATHSYFNSCSNGGRQALLEIQRYPDDYDGFVVGAPWNFQSHSNAGFVWNSQALSAAGAAIPAAKLPAINNAVLAACDAADGLTDGVIANPLRCSFNPDTLLCSGAETTSCLTAAQLGALKKIYAGPSNPRTGAKIFPGFMQGGEDGWAGLVTNLNASGLGNGYFANLTFEDPNWDYASFDFDRNMAFADLKVGLLGNAIDPDLSEARRRGIKIIQYHGWNDQTLQPEYSPQYYESVVSRMGGLRKTQSFYRLFMVPGMRHCYFGPGATSFGAVGQQIPPARDAVHDIQTALEAWVERGQAPDQMVTTKYTDDAAATRTVRLTRPLCSWPSVPRYTGGDPNSASSFACVGGPSRGHGEDDDD